MRERPDFRKMLSFLMVDYPIDEFTGSPYILKRHVEEFTGNSKQGLLAFVREFSRLVFEVVLKRSPFGGTNQFARINLIHRVEMPEDLWKRLELDARIVARQRSNDGFVDFVTGEPVEERRPALDHDLAIPEVRWVLEYLNGLAPELFDWLPPRVHCRLADMSRLSRPDYVQVLQKVPEMVCHPKPHYCASMASPRIYATGVTYLTVCREARKLLTGHLHKMDLKQCQLVVAANLWGCPRLQSLLENPKFSIWDHLCKALRVNIDVCKPALKTAIYAIVFGAGIDGVKRALKPVLGKKGGERFIGLPVIRELIEQRDVALERIKSGIVVMDAFGRPHDIATHQRSNGDDNADGLARSILAYQIQSYEVAIMLEIARTIVESDDLRLVGWLHDGVFIDGPVAAMKKIRSKLKAVAAARARSLFGAPMFLDFDLGERRGRRPKKAATSTEGAA